MSDTVDPLVLLREVIASGKADSIHFHPESKELEFSNFEGTQQSVRIPMEWTTAWAKKGGTGYFTLGQLWYRAITGDMAQNEYVKNAREKGILPIALMEKEAIVKYFRGQQASITSDDIDERIR
jgi:hypothetical protein